jgi:metallophosphoesterase (TIGR00282 family)
LNFYKINGKIIMISPVKGKKGGRSAFMRILILGDIVGEAGVRYVSSRLWSVRKSEKIDFAVVNAENCSDKNGIDEAGADMLLMSGADVLTTGNHAFRRFEAKEIFERNKNILRPANFSGEVAGNGYIINDICGIKILVMNLLGTAFMNPVLENPFFCADKVLASAGEYDVSIVDFHAESTGEKRALGYYLDGRVTCLFGTHTHVTTADEQILPRGTAYITDVGMCGAKESVLGVVPQRIIENMKYGTPTRFEFAREGIEAHGIILELNAALKPASVQRIVF